VPRLHLLRAHPSAVALGAEKVQPWHQDRQAVVYVRQSTAQQVLDHQESARLQYGLTTRAQALGWAPDRILVIDDDQGKSGASAVERAGFQRLVSEVSLDHVGLILGVEMSRLARSNADWHRLLELCALFGTLLADADGLYDPAHYNDRLLLGLKGTMSEAELHLLKQRMYQGKLNKARRGELAVPVPTGYVRRPAGDVAFDPDEQAQHVVRLVFRKFGELGTLNAVLRYLVAHEIRLGIRVREGEGKGELAWRRPNRMTLQNLLKNPIYAGAYAYGRRPVDPRRQAPGRAGTGRTTAAAADWVALLRGRNPAYITWDDYERNLARLRENQARADARGAVRPGPALLAGLLVCARCGRRLFVRYGGGAARRVTYVCGRARADYGGPACQSLAGAALERFVSQQALAALAPAALELSLAAAQTLERERADLLRLWQQRRERAAFEADRAARRFRLAEPEHRLVARQLEREWEDTLAAQQRLEEGYARFLRTPPRGLSEAERDRIRRLASDVPALWHAPETTVAERKEILRQLVERVVVAVVGDSERVGVTIHWAGGLQTAGEVIRPVARLAQLSTYAVLCARAQTLAAEGLSAAALAARLNAEGFRPPKRREQFGRQGVADLLRQLGRDVPHSRSVSREGLGPQEWWLPELARTLPMPEVTLYTWVRRGWLRAHQQAQPPHRWILWADVAEVERLRSRHQRPASAGGADPVTAAAPTAPAGVTPRAGDD
ncbi:MAG TPA: recombinase family protein, partial [Chloroflexota bacterium]|nr:recombinase family protein [Chloroflexota bacterium]